MDLKEHTVKSYDKDLQSISKTLDEMLELVMESIDMVAQMFKTRDQNLGMCIIMGSEEDGINPQLMKRAHQLVTIPMKGQTSSLNVSVAAGIALASLTV